MHEDAKYAIGWELKRPGLSNSWELNSSADLNSYAEAAAGEWRDVTAGQVKLNGAWLYIISDIHGLCIISVRRIMCSIATLVVRYTHISLVWSHKEVGMHNVTSYEHNKTKQDTQLLCRCMFLSVIALISDVLTDLLIYQQLFWWALETYMFWNIDQIKTTYLKTFSYFFWHWLGKESVMRLVVSCSPITACIHWQQSFSSFISALIFVVWSGWKEQRNKTSFCPWGFLFRRHWISCVSVLSYMLKLLDWLYHFWDGNRHGKALYMCRVCNWARA